MAKSRPSTGRIGKTGDQKTAEVGRHLSDMDDEIQKTTPQIRELADVFKQMADAAGRVQRSGGASPGDSRPRANPFDPYSMGQSRRSPVIAESDWQSMGDGKYGGMPGGFSGAGAGGGIGLPTAGPATTAAAGQMQQAATTAARGIASVVNSIQSLASVGGTPTAAIANVGSQIGKMLSMAGPYGAAAGMVVSALSSIPQVMKSAADSVNQYVQAFSPASSARYSRAWADLTASIGEQLLPVLNAATDVVRFFADTIAGFTPTVLPAIQATVDAMRPLGEAFGSLFRGYVKYAAAIVGGLATAFGQLAMTFAPLYEGLYEVIAVGYEVAATAVEIVSAFAELGAVIVPITPLIRLVADEMKNFAAQVKEVLESVRSALGLEDREFDKSSFGKSAVPASTTSVSSMLAKLNEGAFGAARGAPEQKIGTVVGEIKTLLQEMPQKIADAIMGTPLGRGSGQSAGAEVVAGARAGVTAGNWLRDRLARLGGQ